MDNYNKLCFTGLKNIGNTCYMNSCLQVLNNVQELHVILDNVKKYNDIPEKVICTEWNNIRNVMCSGNGIVNPKRFVHFLHKTSKEIDSIFMDFDQNDCDEFLMFMIECIHKSISRPVTTKYKATTTNNVDKSCFELIQNTYNKEFSEITELFNGITVSFLIDKQNNIRGSKPEFFFSLDLPIVYNNKSVPNLNLCLDIYFEGEMLEGDNAWLDEDKNEKVDVKKCFRLWKFPNILVITLKRYHNGLRKIQNTVEFPLINLNMNKYYCYNKTEPVLYDCFGVCNHSGNVNGGHYTSFVKKYDNKWYLYNDSCIKEVNDNNVVSEQAYCLFYRKK